MKSPSSKYWIRQTRRSSYVPEQSESIVSNYAQPGKTVGAFSLLELLLTIAIIALLASILFPAMARSKASARRVICQNNLRQIAIALDMYGSDYQRLPPIHAITKVHSGGRPVGTGVSLWNAHLLPYVSTNLDLFFCPAFPSAFKWDRGPSHANYNFPTNIQGNRPFCYAANLMGVSAWGALGLAEDYGELGRRPSEFKVPSDMIAFGDNTSKTNAVQGNGGAWGFFSYIGWQFSRPTIDPNMPIGRVHNSGGNMVFLDGHLEWGRPEKWLNRSETAARRWNYDNEPHPEFWKQ